MQKPLDPATKTEVYGAVVRTERLTKRYGSRLAVNGVSMLVRSGEVYGFLGPNGAGKTTLLRMLLGLIRPTSGEASVHGETPGSRRANARTGALIEGPGFFPYLSGRDNLRVMARYTRLNDRVVDAVLDQVALADRSRDRFCSYSLGMKQRLGVGAALLGDPDLLVLDEPTNGLDPAGMADMRVLITALAQSGRTVLLSSHLLAEVQEICDRVGVIDAGRLIAESTVDEIRGTTVLRIRATPLDTALAVTMRVVGDDSVEVVAPSDGAPGELRCPGGADDVAALTRELITVGVDVHEITAIERSLEEVFLEMTGPEQAQAVTR